MVLGYYMQGEAFAILSAARLGFSTDCISGFVCFPPVPVQTSNISYTTSNHAPRGSVCVLARPRVAHLDTGAATLHGQLALGPQGRLPTRPNLATGLNLSPGPVSKSKNFSLG